MDAGLRLELEGLLGSRGAARVESRVAARRPATEGKHHPLAEEMTAACEGHLAEMRRTLTELRKAARELSQHDNTHGERVRRAVEGLHEGMKQAERRVLEMRRHLDEDTP